jgi:salicylate hydroxylase
MIYYPISDWSMFNLGCTVLTGQAKLQEAEEFSPDVVLPYFKDRCEIPDRVLHIPKSFRRFVITHREPVDNWTAGAATLLGDAAHPMVQYLAQGAAMALEDAICLGNTVDECDGDLARAFQRYQDIRIVRTARAQISSLMLSKLNHAKGVERIVRNSLFEGRTAEQFYDRLAWLYTAPPYVK